MENSEQNTSNNFQTEITSKTEDQTTASSSKKTTFSKIQMITGWVMIVSASLFALIGIMAVWEVFGENTGDIVWRALSSLAIIAFAALIINVSVRMVEERR